MLSRQVGQSLVELPVERHFALVVFTMFQRLVDAQDNIEADDQGDPSILIDEHIGIASLCWRSLRPRITRLQPRWKHLVGLASIMNAPSFAHPHLRAAHVDDEHPRARA
jgi:hypothetical protein